MASTDPSEELTIEIAGLRLAARVHGDADGLPVLALHGWLDNAASFDRLAPLLSPRLRLVCLDLPGHGLSDHRAPDAYQHFIDYVPQVLAAADALGWERFALLGHSMGGGIAALVAGTQPARVTRLVTIEGLGPLTAEAAEAPERVASYIAEHRALASGRPPRPYRSHDDAIKVRMSQPHAPLTRDAARALVMRGLRPVDGGLLWRHDPRARITSMLRLTEAHVAAFLRRVACPVLAIVADHGWPYDEASMNARLAALPDVRLLRRPGEHHVHLNTPEVIAADVDAFLLDQRP